MFDEKDLHVYTLEKGFTHTQVIRQFPLHNSKI